MRLPKLLKFKAHSLLKKRGNNSLHKSSHFARRDEGHRTSPRLLTIASWGTSAIENQKGSYGYLQVCPSVRQRSERLDVCCCVGCSVISQSDLLKISEDHFSPCPICHNREDRVGGSG